MAQNEFKPVSFNGEPLTTAKLNQAMNNIQYIFERSPRMRYTAPNGEGALTRDTSLKIISGKTPYPLENTRDYLDVHVYFGSFFSAGCKPIVQVTCEHAGGGARRLATLRGHSGEVDHTGFIAHVSNQENPGAGPHPAFNSPGWIHWTATGY